MQGYVYVCLFKNNRQKTFRVNRLVALMFIPNPENKPEVNHKDGNKLNNCVSNLEWNTTKENIEHAYRTGLNKGRTKTVLQYDIQGNLIKEWNSITEATNQLKINNISACCAGKLKTVGGYKWKYKDTQ